MTLPIRDVDRPACLDGQLNGRIDADLLDVITGLERWPSIRLVGPAARAWRAMQAAALADGVTLKATSTVDSFRPYAVQERIFLQRYTKTYRAGVRPRTWNGARWYQKPGTAAAAVPGTSNHGWGLAVDVDLDAGVLSWLLKHAGGFGWSWELQSEPWHIRYVAGDAIPADVLAHEEDDMFTDEDRRLLMTMKGELDTVKADVSVLRKSIKGVADDANGMSWLGERVAEVKASVADIEAAIKDLASKVG